MTARRARGQVYGRVRRRATRMVVVRARGEAPVRAQHRARRETRCALVLRNGRLGGRTAERVAQHMQDARTRTRNCAVTAAHLEERRLRGRGRDLGRRVLVIRGAVPPTRARVEAAHERVRVELAEREVEDEVPVRVGGGGGWALVLDG